MVAMGTRKLAPRNGSLTNFLSSNSNSNRPSQVHLAIDYDVTPSRDTIHASCYSASRAVVKDELMLRTLETIQRRSMIAISPAREFR